MFTRMTHVALALACVLLGLATGCAGSSGPASTDTRSDTLPTLKDRVAFLERYVVFRREYSTLGFHIIYRNGGAFPPSPSEWEVRVIATVPPDGLAAWIPAGVPMTPTAETGWLHSVPGSGQAAGIREWYAEPGRVVGVDRQARLVVYRAWKR